MSKPRELGCFTFLSHCDANRRAASTGVSSLPLRHKPGMIDGMTSTKIAISLPKETLTQARRAVRKGRAASVSAYIASAIEQKAQLDNLDELLSQMLGTTGGALTAVEKTAANAALGRSAK